MMWILLGIVYTMAVDYLGWNFWQQTLGIAVIAFLIFIFERTYFND